jgi:MFS family permease
MGLSNDVIAYATSLLLLPWSLKPLTSPLLEMYKTKKFFVVLFEFVGGLAIAAIGLCLPLPGYFAFTISLFAVLAFCSSMHDIAGDGLYIAALSPKEQASYAGWQGAFWNVGRLFAQGGLVILAGILEKRMAVPHAWLIVFVLAGGILVLLSLYHSRMLPTGGEERKSEGVGRLLKSYGFLGVIIGYGYLAWVALRWLFDFSASQFGWHGYLYAAAVTCLVAWYCRHSARLKEDPNYRWLYVLAAVLTIGGLPLVVICWSKFKPTEFGHIVVTFFEKPGIFILMAFILLYRTAEGQVERIRPLFLLDPHQKLVHGHSMWIGGLGLTPELFGTISMFATGAMVLGSIAGGYFASWLGLKKALLPLVLILNARNLVYVYLSTVLPSSMPIIWAAILFEMFLYGFGYVGVIVLMFQEVAPGKYQTAHYAFANSLMNLGLVLPGMVSGKIQTALGYRSFFLWVLVWVIPPIALFKFIPFRHQGAPPAAEPALEQG